MLNRHLITLLAITFTSFASAEVRLDNLYVPFGAMYYDIDNDFGIDNTVLPQVGIGYHINNSWAAEVMFAKGDSETSRLTPNQDADITQTRIDVLHFYSDWKGFVPYTVAGYGQNDFDSKTLRADDSDIINIGGGLLKNINDSWAARLDVRDIHNIEENQNEYAVNLIMQYRFKTGAKKTAQPAAAEPVKAATPVDAQMPQEKVEIQLSVNFDSNSDVVKQEYFEEIKRVADFMQKYPKTEATIEGHTDDRGDDSYNQNLSERRANAIRNVLINSYAADASRLKAVGYGETKPVADNATRAGQLKNRRVVASFVSN